MNWSKVNSILILLTVIATQSCSSLDTTKKTEGVKTEIEEEPIQLPYTLPFSYKLSFNQVDSLFIHSSNPFLPSKRLLKDMFGGRISFPDRVATYKLDSKFEPGEVQQYITYHNSYLIAPKDSTVWHMYTLTGYNENRSLILNSESAIVHMNKTSDRIINIHYLKSDVNSAEISYDGSKIFYTSGSEMDDMGRSLSNGRINSYDSKTKRNEILYETSPYNDMNGLVWFEPNILLGGVHVRTTQKEFEFHTLILDRKANTIDRHISYNPNDVPVYSGEELISSRTGGPVQNVQRIKQ